MCAFIMRTTCPNANNPWYTHTSRGGKSPCIHDGSLQYCEWPGSTIRNCVGYAWGRFSEILGQPMSNSGAPNAGMWFSQYATNYERGQAPRVGAVGCFDNPGKAGHVLIVEQVYPDGSILTSESGYSSSQPFWNQRRYPPNYMSGSYKFQGFIYNPEKFCCLYCPLSACFCVLDNGFFFINRNVEHLPHLLKSVLSIKL